MEAKQFYRVAKALSDPRRFEVFEKIARGNEINCGSVAECFPVSTATISHHLKTLTDAGLIEVRSEGQFRYFSVRKDTLSAYISELQKRTAIKR
jgi:ArsR family transcriptional regulator